MDTPKKLNDCYFYYYSTCVRGAWCAFRHEESALGCESVCVAWQQGRCRDTACKLRHMELKKNRKTIPCYWESQPGGCRKQHCAFQHRFRKADSAENGPITISATSATGPNNVQDALPTPEVSVNASVLNAQPVTTVVPAVVALNGPPPPQPVVHPPLAPNIMHAHTARPAMDPTILGVMPPSAPADMIQARRVIPHAQIANMPHPQLVQTPQTNPTFLPMDPLVISFENGMRLY